MQILSGELASGAKRGPSPTEALLSLFPTQVCPHYWCCPLALASRCVTSSRHCSTPGEAPALHLWFLLSCHSWTTRWVARKNCPGLL